MAAGNWTLTETTREKMLRSQFDFDSDTFRCALFLSTSDISTSSTTYSTVTDEHLNANGYTTGGAAVAFTLAGTTSVTVAFTTNPVWTCSGGPIRARYAVVYELAGDVICYCELDSTPADVEVADGFTLTVDSNGSPPMFTLA